MKVQCMGNVEVAEKATEAEAAGQVPAGDPLAQLSIPKGRDRFEPQAYVQLADLIDNAALERKFKGLEAERLMKRVASACVRNTGVELDEAAKEGMDAIQGFKGLMEHSAPELKAVQEAVANCDKLTASEKKRYSGLIDQTIALQDECRDDPMKCWVYIGRDSENNDVFKMGPVHARYFRIWNDPKPKNTLIMAPPGHCKTTSMRGWVIYRLGHNPNIRCLIIKQAKDHAKSEVLLLKAIMRSDRFRAMFPGVRVLERSEAGMDTNLRFTVSRVNVMSREPTIEGAAIQSRINGNRYDWIVSDDLCPPAVQEQPAMRNDANRRWESVIKERLGDPRTSRIDMICTPWHEDDVAGRIRKRQDRGQLRGWTVAIDEFAIKDDRRGLAIPIWDRYNSEYFEDKKLNEAASYTLNFRLVAKLDKQKEVRYLQYYNAKLDSPFTTEADRVLGKALQGPEGYRCLSIDPAATAGKGASDTGVTELIIGTLGYGFVPQIWTLQLGPVAMHEWIAKRVMDAIEEGFPYEEVIIEAQGGMKGMVSEWIPALQGMLKEWNCTHAPRFQQPGVKHAGTGHNWSKGRRLRECASYLERGFIRFAGETRKDHKNGRLFSAVENGTEIALLKERIIDFNPAGRTDGVDALTQAILWNRAKLKNPSLKVPQQKRVERERPVGRLAQMLRDQLDAIEEKAKQGPGGEEQKFFQAMSERNVA